MDRRQREMLDVVELEMTEIYYDEEEKKYGKNLKEKSK